jgi:hypothetical protein
MRAMESMERERERLAAVYAEMTNAQLEEIAQDYSTLTDTARTVLRNEMDHRGLRFALDEKPDVNDTTEELITIRRFRDVPDAILAKGLLESAGIECVLADENMIRLDWFISNALGNIRLRVKSGDADAALRILEEPSIDPEEEE